jgi:hypothetical protein
LSRMPVVLQGQQMNSRERVQIALSHHEPDRIPLTWVPASRPECTFRWSTGCAKH